MPDSNQSKQPGDSAQASPRTFSELIAGEPDLMRRCMMINGEMFLTGSGVQLANFTPEEFMEKSNLKHFSEIAKQVTEEPEATREWLDDESKRTPEQQQALEAATREMLDIVKRMATTNYLIAGIHVFKHVEDMDDDLYKPLLEQNSKDYYSGISGEPLNVPMFSVLYFFATHTDIDPAGPVTLKRDDLDALVSVFQDIDTYYREHKAELHTLFDLQQAYITARNPNPAQAAETLGNLSKLAVVPKNHVAPNNKLANVLTRATRKPTDIIEIALEVSKHGAKRKVTSTCLLSYEGDNVKISGRQPFTEFDRNVYNAVVSLYVAGNRIITADMVWRTMTGKTEQEQPSAGIKSAVTKSLDKMRFMRARIDCSDEFKMRRIQFDGKAVAGAGYDDNLLHLSVTWVATANATVRAYEILSAPVLYRYSAAVKQIQTVPIGLLDVKKLDRNGNPTTHSLEYTERRVIVKGYLLRRIQGMKGTNGLVNRCISFTDYQKNGQPHEGLYTIAGCPELSQPMPDGLTDADKQKRKNDARYIREDAAKILGYWTATGYIKGYKTYKDGATIAGYEITL